MTWASVPPPRCRFRVSPLPAATVGGHCPVVFGQGSRKRVSATIGAVIYGVGLVSLFWASAIYHRHVRTEKALLWARRVDHASIFVFIGACYTVVALSVLSLLGATLVLVAVWSVAGTGVVVKLALLGPGNRLISWMYSALGWASVALLPSLARVMSATEIVLLLVGGLLYGVGSLVLLRKSPDPVPQVFGYHEIWHSFVVLAVGCQFVSFWGLVG